MMRKRQFLAAALVVLATAVGFTRPFMAQAAIELAVPCEMAADAMAMMSESSPVDCEGCPTHADEMPGCHWICGAAATIAEGIVAVAIVIAPAAFELLLDNLSDGLAVPPEPHPPRSTISLA